MVYNGTSCGLNLYLLAPHFVLPIAQHNLRDLLPGYSQYGMDVGEMFLNFPLHPESRPFSGVYIKHTNIISDEEGWDNDRTRVW